MSDSDSERASPAEEGFISRWSHRKHAAKTGAAIADDSAAAIADEVLLEDEAAGIAVVEDDLPGDSDMPPLETLDEDSDYSGFMSPKVSDELRNLALRKLFHSGSFNHRDGLDDYDDDFTSFEKLGDIVTADMRYQMERVKELVDDSDSSAEGLVDGNESPALEAAVDTDTVVDAETDSAAQVAALKQGGEENLQTNENEQHVEEQYIEDRNANEDK